MRVLVCGGRRYPYPERVYKVLDEIKTRLGGEFCVIQGGATGADQAAREWCDERFMPCATFHVWWEREGGRIDRSAGPIRNKWMVKYGNPDLVIAFAGNKGTASMVRLAHEAGIEVQEHE